MATILRNAAAAAANRGQPSSFYNKDKTNPVYLSLEQETKKFMGYMRKRNSPDYRKPDDESCSRAADTLFELWNKYEPKLPLQYYQEKLLSMGDFLLTVKEYSLALWQCYERYLLHFGNVNTDEITDVGTFKSCFFPDGFDGDDAGLTFRALMGKSISMYQVVKSGDPKLQNRQSVDKCVQILDFLRLVMQVVLPKEKLCWLVYNGTIHIYSISRHLMSLGHSARVVQYLLWASICMETSVPLLAVKYLPWRATLYTAVCQCYFDCKSSQHAEAFARRGLAKINELSHLEKMSNSTETNESESCFRQATVKMAVMIFRRSVFETRRKPKNQLRPKTRANLKDAANLPWPRTPTEKLLADMFDGSAAQFLCIMESLNDTNRRIILTSPPAPDSDVEILDVYAELFLAAQEILAGGGGNRGAGPKPVSNLHLPALAGVVQDKALLTLATKGDDGATIDGAIRLVKMAYCFEQWDVFDQLVETVLLYIRNVKGEQYAWDEKALELLQAMEKVNPSRRHKRVLMTIAEEDTTAGKEKESTANQDQAPSVVRSAHAGDDLVNVADVLMSIVNGQFHPSKIEVDMVVDTALFLWNKTKAVFQKHQTGSLDNPKYLQRMDNPNKWVYLLDVVHQVLCWCGLSSVDPALTAEVVLRLALVLESSANIDEDNPSGGKESKTSLSDYGNVGDGSQQYVSRASMLSTSMLNLNPRNQLMQAREILELGLQNVSYARQAVALTDGKSIADVSWAKLGEASEVQPAGDDQHRVEYDLQSNISFVTSMVSQEYNEVFTPEPEKDHEKDTEREVTKATIDTLHTIDERGTSKKEQKDHGKQQQEQVQGSATAVWNTIKDLHLELILIYHRVCLKLAAMGPDPSVNVPRPFQRQSTSKMGEGPIQGMYVESFKDLQARCNKNNLSKALLNMQQAMLIGSEGETTLEQKALMEEAVKAILKAQTEEKRIHLENNRDFPSIEEVSPTEVPPAPILLCRTDTMMVFKPAPFKPASGQTVSWYRIFARTSSGSNVKVRLNDYYLPGTGEEIPSHRCEMRISGLQPNEKYIFAVAAYTADGSLIGGSVGESSKPILASHPLPVLMTWGFLSQLAYQVGCYNIAHQACDTLWNHFIEAPPAPESLTYITESEKDFKLTLMKLNQRLVCQTSPVLLRQYLTSIFIGVDMSVREGELFCDVLCDKGPLYTGQMKRLLECEKMLVAVELAGWLNEANSALQAVVQCYGLLAPLIFYKIPSTAIVQILQRCHVVLLEIPAGLRQKRQQSIADSLHHMTACITYQMAKVLRSWGQKSLANNINESGRKLLTIDAAEEQPPAKKDGKSNKEGDAGVSAPEKVDMPIDAQEMETAPLALLKKKKLKKVGGFGSKDDGDGSYNEELKALEAHQLSLSKQAQYDHELTGSEDPSILHAYIAYLPSKLAYREVSKFKKRHRYLEFFVQVAQKALTEGMSVQVVEWCDETSSWLSRRNEQIIGMKPFLGKQTGAGVVTVSGDDPKRFHAAMVEYNKEKDMTVPRVSGTQSKTSPTKSTPRPKRKRQYKPLHVTPNMSDAAKQAQEEAELKAIEKMSAFFPDCFRQWMRKRRLRKVCIEELPWRCQLTLIQGLSHFSTFMQKLELKDKTTGISNSTVYKTSFLDPEWLTFETAGTLVVGWEGGPSRNSVTAQEKKRKALEYGEEDDPQPTLDRFDEQENRPKTTATGIEIAAALATGAPPPPLYMIPPEPADTPRTYRSEASYVPPPKPKQKATELAMINTKETMDILSKTFTFFRRSIVLAHRGKHWTLLHNSCRSLWNCIHTTLLRTFSSSAQSEDCLLSPDQLRELVWQPLHMATDCVLDMLTQLQTDLEARASKERKKNKKLGDLFESFMGEAVNEKGGASLKFENPLDNTSISDLRWVKRLVMRTIELLYYEQRWEKLVDIALRFSALSNDRYAEQIIPTLVLAQRQLEERIQMLGGDRPPQKHFQLLRSQLNGVITAKDYLTCQLYISRDEVVPTPIRPGATLDPLGHGAYTSDDGKKIVSVPLEIPNSLQSLREVFEKTKYTCHALQHSRKLLVLYMAGQQNNPGFDISLSRQVSRVDFLPNTAKPQPTMPPDISREEYTNLDDVQTSCLPRSQLGTVIEAYEKTIEMLLAKNQKGLVAQAMHELGNLQYHASNIRAAYRWWAESLDHVLNATDALHTWRDLFKDNEDISSTMLERCGLWGCVLGGVLASNIAQYILTSDLGLRLDCCFLSGYFFKALFRSSLPHPKTDRDYALYEVGEGCEVTNLVPGVDLLSEKFRADGRQMIAALRWVSEELARGKHNLFVLPLLTLYLYFTTFICRDLQRSVDGRILKVRVLTDMQLFHEALIVLLRLIHGERLPHIGDSSFRQVESKMTSLKFNTSKPITAACNLKVMEILLDKRLSSSLATLYGPHLTCHLSLVQAHFLVAVADTIPVIPVIEDSLLTEGGNMKQQTMSTGPGKGKGAKTSHSTSRHKTKSTTDNRREAEEDDEHSGQHPKRFSNSKKNLTLELIKGTYLGIADQMVTTIAEVIQENAEHDKHGLRGLPAAELELVVLCKLEQAAIAKQKHHAPLSARIVLSAIKVLKSSDLFKLKKTPVPPPRPPSLKGTSQGGRRFTYVDVKVASPENSQFEFQNFQSRSRLDARLWLTCRHALVQSLMMQVGGLGEVKTDPDNTVLQELADCRQYCAEGLSESEACGDVEMQAEFLMFGAFLNIMEGKSLEHTIGLVHDVTQLLQKIPKRSIPADQLYAMAIMFLTDLEASERDDETSLFTERTLDQYLVAQGIILKQMEELGERIEHCYPKDNKEQFSTPVSPIRNIYLPHVLRLAQVKLRIGHAMARNAAKYIRSGGTEYDHMSLWSDALGVLTTAKELCQASVGREANLEAEILLHSGKIQRMLVYQNKFQPRKAAETLIDAIKTTFSNEHDLGLMRQAYLEIALVYLYALGMVQLKENSSLELTADLGPDDTHSKTSSAKSKTKAKKRERGSQLSSRTASTQSEEVGDMDKYRKAVWVAIRSASAIAQAQRSRILLIGDVSVTSQPLSDKAQEEIQEFVALDLVSDYVLGERKKVYKNEIEEELAPLIEATEVKHIDTYDEQVQKAKTAAGSLSWIQFLGYQSILQRLSNTATISASSQKSNKKEEAEGAGELGPEFDLGFISHAQCDMSVNHDVIRSMLFSGVWSRRLTRIHVFLTQNLKVYSSDCVGIFPPQALMLPPLPPSSSELSLNAKYYSANTISPSDIDENIPLAVQSEPGKLCKPPGSVFSPFVPSDKFVVTPNEMELALQFYQPSLEECDPLKPEASGPDARVMMLFALYKKVGGSVCSGVQWISLSQLNDLHDRLAVLAQRSEISLQEKKKREPVAASPTPTGKGKKGQRIRALSPKVEKDEHLENLLRQCVDDVTTLLGISVESTTTDTALTQQEIPFEVNKKNILSLENLFDPALGFIAKNSDLSQWLIKMLTP